MINSAHACDGVPEANRDARTENRCHRMGLRRRKNHSWVQIEFQWRLLQRRVGVSALGKIFAQEQTHVRTVCGNDLSLLLFTQQAFHFGDQVADLQYCDHSKGL